MAEYAAELMAVARAMRGEANQVSAQLPARAQGLRAAAARVEIAALAAQRIDAPGNVVALAPRLVPIEGGQR